MGNPSGQGAYGFHFLSLLELSLKAFFFSNIDHGAFNIIVFRIEPGRYGQIYFFTVFTRDPYF